MIALISVLAFALWTLITLLLGVGVYRWSMILTGRATITDWPADQPHGPPHYRRMIRAHANCVENLPVFAAIVLVATVMEYSSCWFDVLSVSVVGLRVFQTAFHVASGSSGATYFRFVFFILQVFAMLVMATLAMNFVLAGADPNALA